MSSVPLAEPDAIPTPLNALHEELGARMVRFAGYRMPVHTRRPGGGTPPYPRESQLV